MLRIVPRSLARGGVAMLGAACLALVAAPAEARVSVGVGIGVPLVGPAYPAPVYPYPPPPAYYYPPPPAYYYPPPAVAAPAPAPSATTGNCREYSSTEIIAGQRQQVYGTACLQPDGTWRIMD